MNYTEFTFIGLVKLNIERPVLGMNPSSLRFVKYMSLDLSSEKLYRVFVTLFELVKLKRGTHRSWWGNGKGIILQIMEVFCRYLWTWHFYAHHVSQLGIQLISATIHFHESSHSFESFKRMHCPLSHWVSVPSSHAAKSFVVPPNVQRGFEEVLPLQST